MSTETTEPKPPQTPQVPATTQPRETRVVSYDDGPLAYLFDTARFEQIYRVASGMAKASLIPKHLRGKDDAQTAANCFLVVNQAIRWGFDPFAVAPETYEVHGKLGFQGKLVAAVINARAGLAAPLQAIYNTARGDEFGAVVYGSAEQVPDHAYDLLAKYAEDGDKKALTALSKIGVLCIRLTVGQSKTENEIWKKDPEQKLFYSGATKWARRHRPEVVLGVLTEDDVDRHNDDGRTFDAPAGPPVGRVKLNGATPTPQESAPLPEPSAPQAPPSDPLADFNSRAKPQAGNGSSAKGVPIGSQCVAEWDALNRLSKRYGPELIKDIRLSVCPDRELEQCSQGDLGLILAKVREQVSKMPTEKTEQKATGKKEPVEVGKGGGDKFNF